MMTLNPSFFSCAKTCYGTGILTALKNYFNTHKYVAVLIQMIVNAIMKIICLNCGLRNEDVSDHCSWGHYLSSKEKKA